MGCGAGSSRVLIVKDEAAVKQQYRPYLKGTVTGFFLGFFLLHPFSMVLQRPVPSARVFDFSMALNMFALNHMPMAFFFGLLGAVFGVLTTLLSREKRHADVLEGLLPICSYCRRIRDDQGVVAKEGRWYDIETYIVQKTDTKFTHGICPECHRKIMEELDSNSPPAGDRPPG
jgi:hypothetical protein